MAGGPGGGGNAQRPQRRHRIRRALAVGRHQQHFHDKSSSSKACAQVPFQPVHFGRTQAIIHPRQLRGKPVAKPQKYHRQSRRPPARHQVRDIQNPAAPQFRHAGAGFARIRKAKGGNLAAGRLAQMMHIITQRQRLEHVQRRHAGFREAVANLVRHLPAQFAEDVADPPGLLRLDAVEKDGEMIGKNGAVRAAPARVMRARESNRRRPGCRAGPRRRARPGPKPPDKNGCAGNRRLSCWQRASMRAVSCSVKADEAVMVAARAGARPGRHQAEERFVAGFMEPLHRTARLFRVGPPAGRPAAPFAGD